MGLQRMDGSVLVLGDGRLIVVDWRKVWVGDCALVRNVTEAVEIMPLDGDGKR